MRVTLTALSFATALTLSVYLYRLAVRTAYFVRSAAVGGDIATIVATVCVLGLVCALLALRLQFQPRWVAVALLVVNALLALIYLILYTTGKFGPMEPKI